MKSPASQSPDRKCGPSYWRSLDELADTPEFQSWMEREFPQGASEFVDPVNRRHFLKIMSASFLLAGLGMTGCRRPEETIYPFSKMPENFIHGVPQHYATAMPDRGGAQALLVKSLDGRPIKIEGNPSHPFSLNGTDRFAQASLLDLYDPDRAIRFSKNGNQVTWEVAQDFLATFAIGLAAGTGDGTCILLGESSSPSRARIQQLIRQKFPGIKWFCNEAVDLSVHQSATSLAHESGENNLTPYYKLDAAKVVVSLDCDFLGADYDSPRLIRDFSRGRRIESPADTPNRLYAVEALTTITGANADHRLRLPAGQMASFAANLTAAVLGSLAIPEAAGLAGELAKIPPLQAVNATWIKECAADLIAHRGACLVMAGYRQPPVVHFLANAINHALGNEGKTVELHPRAKEANGTLVELAQLLQSGNVKNLIVCGGNPAYTAPADLDWATRQRQAAQILRLGYHEDETAKASHWFFPAAHYLESWGDARTSDGTVVPVQPLIAPLFGGLTELEFLSRLAGLKEVNPHEIVRDTVKILITAENFEAQWRQFLRDGFLPNSGSRHMSAPLSWNRIAEEIKPLAAAPASTPPTRDRLELVFHRDYRVDDGRFNNNGWLQELPDPISKVCWENVVTLSMQTARDLGIFYQNPEKGKLLVPKVQIEINGRSLEAAIWIQPGQADYTLGLALGYGRTQTGRVGQGSGHNAYRLQVSQQPHLAVGARITVLNQTHRIATTQDHWAMEGRAIVREANLDQFRAHPDFVQNMDLDAHMPKGGQLYAHPHTKNPAMKGISQWGMTVDLNRCIGCSTCMIACQSENNIPIVGKDQVARGREMHWIRLDRYFSVRPDDKNLADPQVVTQPMFCQHCENAPCENVCPVNATVHDEEGLNVMVYNRCVGTRYCSNNCPFKVRRFNFFDYNHRPLDKLYLGPLAPKGMPDLLQMIKNPEVTVRMRGVMEKCTFCIQRIEQAKIAQKIKAGPSDDVRVPDGTITPACAQACPAEALVFGDVADPASRVSRIKAQSRNYSVLGFLNVNPRTTYLARIRNPNPKMPDYYQQPLSLAEYIRENGDPMGHPATSPAVHNEADASKKGGHQ